MNVRASIIGVVYAVLQCREYKRDGLNIICRIANHHADILCVPAELHMVNEAVIQEVDFPCVTASIILLISQLSVVLVSFVCFSHFQLEARNRLHCPKTYFS